MYTLLDRLYLVLQQPRAWVAARRRWANYRPESAGIRVHYDVPGWSAATVSGGAVKIRDLARVFPDCPQGANILYLVSSALPLHADIGVRFARRAGLRVVLNQNGVAYPAWCGHGWRVANEPGSRVLAMADHVMYQSQFCKSAADRFLGPARSAWSVQHNPVDTTVFLPASTPVTHPPLRLLLAGTHQSVVRVQLALDVVAVLRRTGMPVRLTIAGKCAWSRNPAEDERELACRVAAAGLQGAVSIRGAYTQTECVQLMQAAHVLLHTKVNDPCPRLVVEALACGLPVVYSATGGVPELVGPDAGAGVAHQTGWDREAYPDAEAMADAVRTVAAALPAYAAAARRQAVAHLDLAGWVDAHGRIFRALRGIR